MLEMGVSLHGMKNWIATILCSLLFTSLNAQGSEESPTYGILSDNVPVTNANGFRAWYNYGRMIDVVADDKSYFRNPLFPDSTVWVQFDNGYDRVSKHSLGQVFDPYAPIFSANQMSLDSSMGYHLDSIGIYYRYFREIDSLPDILAVQIYKTAKIEMVEDPSWSSRCSYASVAYDPILRRGGKADREFTYFLEADDSTGFGDQKVLKFPVDWEMEPGERAAVVITYFPINPYLTGDTIDPYSSRPLRRKINAFLMYEMRDSDPNIEPGYYNNGLVATRDVRYDASWSFWRKKMKPGTLWATSVGIYHSDVSFYITSEDPVGQEALVKDDIQIRSLGKDGLELSAPNYNFDELRLIDLSGREIPFSSSPQQKTLKIIPENNQQGLHFLLVDGKAYKVFL